jgi:alpha-glucuronidase
MTPLGIHHIMGTGFHYGPAPWVDNAGRADWNPVYYHRADSAGIGFDRTPQEVMLFSQYSRRSKKTVEDAKTCDEKYLLWFHHVPWKYKMKSGRTLWMSYAINIIPGLIQ